MSELTTRPLMTFAVCAYNQEQYIREAVEGALAQTYSPLEIILSDDCSSDRTFEIMRDMAAGYRGPHRIVLNHNSVNLGLANHVNRVVEMTQGEILVGSAGDDISLPERTTLVAEVWEASGRRATSIHGRWIGIDERGMFTGDEKSVPWPTIEGSAGKQSGRPIDFVTTRKPHVQGSCHAFSKRLFTVFGPMPKYVVYEDLTLAFRSILIGEIHFINRPLVKYRRHSQNTYAPIKMELVKTVGQVRAYHQQAARELGRKVKLYDCFRADLQTLVKTGAMNGTQAAELENAIYKVQNGLQLQLAMYDKRLICRMRTAWKLIGNGSSASRVLARLLPRTLTEMYFLAHARRCRQNAEM
jgi:glycosyltransferase involved in cell wall biosynthesis